MAKSTYSGNQDNNPTSAYKYAAEGIAKEYKLRMVNEQAFQKKKADLLKASKIAEYNSEIEKAQQLYNWISQSNATTQAEKEKALEDFTKLRLQKEQEIADEEARCAEEALGFSLQCAQQKYNSLTASQQAFYLKEQQEQQKIHLQELQNTASEFEAEYQALQLIATDKSKSIEERQSADRQAQIALEKRNNTLEQAQNISNNIYEIEDARNSLSKILITAQYSYLNTAQREKVIQDQIAEAEERQADLRQQMIDEQTAAEKEGRDVNQDLIAALNEELTNSVQALALSIHAAGDHVKAAADQKVNDQFIENIKKAVELKTDNAAKKEMLSKDSKSPERKAAKEVRALERESQKLDEQEKAKQANEDFGPLLKENLKSQVSLAAGMTAGFKALEDLSKSIDTNIDSFYEYQGTINARLQGSETSFKDAAKAIDKNVGFSGIVSQKQVIENIKNLTDSGVAYNLELRAFLASTSENIANTFDVFNSNLARMIRIQQADTTAARLGMEASLTKLFNQYFSDTSYLTDVFDSVTESILDASAQMTRDQSMQFEYIVQKWLGALYSLGLSQEAVSTIAQGINYLGTGNVEALNSNDALRTLMAMSASHAGMDFGQILVDGLDPDGTNLLMKSMIQYLADIASNTSTNQVTKAVYAELFGVSTPDLNVFTNLSTSVDSLFASTQTYQQSMNEVSSQLSQIANRLHISQIIDTAFENIQLETATNIGGNVATYGLWKTLNVIEGLTGGIQIPAFSVMGNMVDLDTTVTALAKSGIAGLSMMSSLLGGLFSGNLFGSLDLKSWGFDEYTSRGAAPSQIRQGMATGISEESILNTVGSSSAQDIKSTSMTDATNEAKEDSEITNKDVKDNVDIYTQMRDALWESESVNVLSELGRIRTRLDKPFEAQIALLNGIYNRVWKAQVKVLDKHDMWLSETTAPGEEDEISASLGGETISIVNLTQDYVDKLQETLLGATYKVELTNIDALNSSSEASNQELHTKIEEANNQSTETISKQISDTESSITSLLIQEDKKGQAGQEVTTTGDTTNNSIFSKNEENTLIEGTDALNQLLALLSLDRIFKVEISDILDNGSSNNILSQLIQSGSNSSSNITSIVDEIQNNSIMDSISQLHADVTTVKSTLGITEGNTEGGRVVVTGMSDEMKSYINNAIKSMIVQALSDQTNRETSKDDYEDLTTTLQKALSLMNLNVNVTNDFFNEYLQKNAFAN